MWVHIYVDINNAVCFVPLFLFVLVDNVLALNACLFNVSHRAC